MRRSALDVVSLLLAAAAVGAPCGARADAYAWGGRIGSLEVEVELLGFHEGAGVGGWSEESARRFARRGAELASMFRRPVRLVETIDSAELVAIIGGRTIPTGIRGFVGDDAQWDALVALFRARGLAPRAAPPPSIYTIELVTRAEAGVDLEVEPPGSMFREACAPCRVPAVHTVRGRRVVGLFSSRRAASRALAWLGRRGVSGRIALL